MDAMALQNGKAYAEWRKLRQRIEETDAAAKRVELLWQERKGKRALAAARAAAAKAKQTEEAQKEAYERAKGEALRATEAKQAEKTPS